MNVQKLYISTNGKLKRNTLLNPLMFLQICVKKQVRRKTYLPKEKTVTRYAHHSVSLCVQYLVGLSWWKKNINQINARHNSYCSECINSVKRNHLKCNKNIRFSKVILYLKFVPTFLLYSMDKGGTTFIRCIGILQYITPYTAICQRSLM